jgi:hypothetical protein
MATTRRERPAVTRLACLTAVSVLIFLASRTAEAKTYTADRFDSMIRVLPGGDLEVVETIVFRFQEGEFTYVFRELPTRRTDGIEIISAQMDDREMPRGEGPGQIEVRSRSRVRVTWRFPAVSGSAHTFTLRYLVRGVVRQQDGYDVLHWRALPTEHSYTIASSTTEVLSPVAVIGQPAVETRRVDDVSASGAERQVRVTATGIGRNGWVELASRFPASSIVPEPPAWQQRQQRARELAPRWALGAAAVGLAALILLIGIRQRYDAPRREPLAGTVPEIPDQLPPALAGVVAGNGSVSMEHAMAALFSLADRGLLSITEEPRGRFGQRRFTVRRTGLSSRLEPHEETLLELAFTDKGRREDEVEFSKARSRVGRHVGRLRATVHHEMSAAGLIDADRQRVHRRFGRVSLGMILLASALLIPFAFLVRENGAWPLLIPGSLVAAGIIGFIFRAATTPLSDDGVRRRDRWRAYQKHLSEVARSRAHLRTESPAHVLPFAVGLGLAAAWSKLVKSYPAATPRWFHAVSASGDDGGFPAFIAVSGNHGSGGGGSAGGGAAGGGGSGAG